MSFGSYNGVSFGQIRTEYLQAEPVLDALGNVDPLFTHLTLELTSILHPNVVASNIVPGVGPIVNGVAIPQGDRAGLSLKNLRELLLQQRKPLLYNIGPDNVIVSPPLGVAGGIQGFLDRDCKEGPHVIHARVAQIEGDFSFFIYFKVETWVPAFSNVLLSNRWAMTHDVDLYGLTTRIVNGQATIRADAIPFRGVQSVDDFRRSLFLPVPPNFRRDRINCQVNPDGTILNYIVVDKETGLAMGPNSVAVTMHGNVTAGTESEIKNVQGLAQKILDMEIAGFLKSLVPVSKANALIRVQGNRGAARKDLINLATAVALDRSGTLALVSAYATQGLDSDKTPWAEVRIEFFPGVFALVGGLFNPLKFSLQMNLTDNFSGGPNVGGVGGNPIVPPITSNNAAGLNPNLAGRPSNTRGSYVGRMAVQTFAADGKVPNAPPADAASLNQAPF